MRKVASELKARIIEQSGPCGTNYRTCRAHRDSPDTKLQTFPLLWGRPRCGCSRWPLWQSEEKQCKYLMSSEFQQTEPWGIFTFTLAHLAPNPHLSSLLQLLLVFSSVSGEHLHLNGSSHCNDGHQRQEQQSQLPAVHKTQDQTGAHVGEVLSERGHTHACGLNGWFDTLVWAFGNLWPAVVEAYPLHLGCICGQSRSERTNTVFWLVKPAQILQRRFERSTEGPDQLLLWLPCR